MYSKLSALLFICIMLLISNTTPILGCGYCGEPIHKKGAPHHGTVPPVLNPPTGPSGKPCPPRTLASTPKAQPACSIDALKLGACVDLLGGLIHIGLGDPAVHTCCPILKGLVEVEAAICLCTTLKVKLLNLNIFVPLALQVLLTCGKTPPPGFTCTI